MAENNSFTNMTPEQIYNRGVSCFNSGQFREALTAFSECFRLGEFQAQSAYLRGLCQKALGLKVEYPPGLHDLMDHLHTIYVANNLAAYLTGQGHQASLTQQGSTCRLEVKVENALYLINVANVMGRFTNQAWRREGTKPISLTDGKVNPNPTTADLYIIKVVNQADKLPPALLGR